jgi:hypothetical protein
MISGLCIANECPSLPIRTGAESVAKKYLITNTCVTGLKINVVVGVDEKDAQNE